MDLGDTPQAISEMEGDIGPVIGEHGNAVVEETPSPRHPGDGPDRSVHRRTGGVGIRTGQT
jgi:hypothetical protein